MTAVLAEAWDPDERVLTRKLSPDEIAWIDNERLLCTHDYWYYTNYVHIIDAESGRFRRFQPNIAQQVVVDVWAEMESHYWAIMMMQLKARRLGVSTLSGVEASRRLIFRPDTAALIASSTPDKTEGLAKIVRDIWTRLPWWMMPTTQSKFEDGMPMEFPEHNATLSLRWGNQFSGMGRGMTPSFVWLSEVCEFPHPEEDIDSSLLKSIIEGPEKFFILESTALGRDNWYHRTWKGSKEGWETRMAKLYPMFLPWYVGNEIYPSDTWLLKHPMPMDWQPTDRLLRHAEKAREFVHANPRLQKYMGAHWVMPKEQLWYYHVDRNEHELKNQLNRFLAEMASDDFDAFQSTNHSAFPQDVILATRDALKPPVGIYKLRGVGASEEDIPAALRPTAHEVDLSKPPIRIPCVWGQYRGDFELVPLKYQGFAVTGVSGAIILWELPRDDHEYSFGVDSAEGIGQDSAVIEVLRRDTLTEPDEQVCEFASAWVGPMELWPWCMALGTLYSTRINGDRRQAKSAIEVKLQGDAVQWELRKRGWMNHLVWPRVLDNKRVDMAKATKLGFVTNSWSKPYMLGIVLSWVNQARIQINSPYFVEEMESFEKDEDRQFMKAAYGAHDDRIMALGFAMFAFHLFEVRSHQLSTAQEREHLAGAPDPTYDAGWQGRDVESHGFPPSTYAILSGKPRRY